MTASPTAPEHYAESASCSDHSPDTRNMVSAAVPSEEEIEAEIRPMSYEGADLTECVARILALFAAALAEKEAWSERGWKAYRIAHDQAMENGAAARSAEARALAAEAERDALKVKLEMAVAGERKRCLAIVEAQVPEWVKERSGPYWDGYREAMEDAADDMRKGASAAIRGEG